MRVYESTQYFTSALGEDYATAVPGARVRTLKVMAGNGDIITFPQTPQSINLKGEFFNFSSHQKKPFLKKYLVREITGDLKVVLL